MERAGSHHPGAKTQLSRLIARAEADEEIVIARGMEPIVTLTLVQPRRPKREPGRLKGIADLPDSFFFDPLPDDELRLWNGEDGSGQEP